jgi:hypothetical protein
VADWKQHARREEERYRDGERRLPTTGDPDARQRQLARMGNAAAGTALAKLMDGKKPSAREWFVRAAERYRESYADAPPASWGRPIGILKARLLAADWDSAAVEAHWTLEQDAAAAASPIGRYAACLAFLILGRDEEARSIADSLRTNADFPTEVGDALAMIAAQDPLGYTEAIEAVLESFERRDEYLEDLPVADTVMVLERLAERRDMAARLTSPLLPA